MKKNTLTIGGAGFIGSNLCEKLAEDANNIIYSLDNYSTGRKANHVSNERVFEEIAKAKPPKLLVVGDLALAKDNGKHFLPIRSSGMPHNE